MNLSISKHKLIHNFLLSGIIIFLPLSAISQGADSLVVNASFKATSLDEFDIFFENHDKSIKTIDHLNFRTEVLYYINNNWFIGITGEFYNYNTESLNVYFMDKLKMYGFGGMAGKNIPLSPQLSLLVNLTLKMQKGYMEYKDAIIDGNYYAKATISSNIFSTQANLSPVLLYKPFKRIGFFVQLDGLKYSYLKEHDEYYTLVMNLQLKKANLGFSYSITD